jgi:hypothetical protein
MSSLHLTQGIIARCRDVSQLVSLHGLRWRMVYANPVGHPTLHDAGGVGWAVEVQEGLDEGVVVRAAR